MHKKTMSIEEEEDMQELERFRSLIRRGFSANPWKRVGGKPDFFNIPNVDLDDEEHTSAKNIKQQKTQFNENFKKTPKHSISNIGGIDQITNDVIKKIVQTSKTNPELAEALNIKRDENGVYVNNYYIRVKKKEVVGKMKKHFDVIDVVSKKVLVSDLFLYEAALSIVRFLNSGKKIKSKDIENVIFLEKKYSQYSIDALLHMRNMIKAKKERNFEKEFFSENRYKDSLNKAVIIENNIKETLSSTLI